MMSFKDYSDTQPTNEMLEWYAHRTNKHIDLVIYFANAIEGSIPAFEGLDKIAANHDANKFHDRCFIPYVFLTWKYKQDRDGIPYEIPKEIDVTSATEYHVKTNAHHPEYWSNQTNTINKKDRDKPNKLIDATQMSEMSIAEMVADWCAMSRELNDNPHNWAEKNINVRWKFTEAQVNLIYKLLSLLWRTK